MCSSDLFVAAPANCATTSSPKPPNAALRNAASRQWEGDHRRSLLATSRAELGFRFPDRASRPWWPKGTFTVFSNRNPRVHDPLAPGLPPPAPWRPWSSFLPDSPRRQAERDLEVARRLGYWFTAEDRQWVREQERAEALVRRSAAIQQATRVGTVGVLVAAWAFPPLWPLAVVAS